MYDVGEVNTITHSDEALSLSEDDIPTAPMDEAPGIHPPEDSEGPREGSIEPPSRWLLLIEGRAVYELASSAFALPLLRRRHQGDGHPVLTLPGFLASDTSTGPLRYYLQDIGYAPHRWHQGRNLGPREGVEVKLEERIRHLYRRYDGRKVSLLGWSLGGLYARLMAHRLPDLVRCVITLGSPFGGDPRANHAWRLFEQFSGQPIDEIAQRTREHIRTPPPVPSTAIYSRSDGVAHWRCCVDPAGPETESVEVRGSHLGLGFNPMVLHVIADRLGQPEGGWKPFRRRGLERLVYRRAWGRKKEKNVGEVGKG